ncbi:ganglioside-induced differentiation-associated protein 1-like [Diadema antillarum]|uniref:ganglioside-induced differentiation-associated protein 1-like n=1 Tax=Diadema antillarum TaxID=105358 RepID=UPI003A83F624
MSTIPVLYHAEGSFYSQKARLALAEKGVAYKSRLVNLIMGEVHELWYLRTVNPHGTVPAMEHKGTLYTDSADIIDYVDTLPSSRPKLCPPGDSDEAVRARHFRQLLDPIEIDIISYGAIFNRHLTKNSRVPNFMSVDQMKAKMAKGAQALEEIKQKHPDLALPLTNRRNLVTFSDTASNEVAFLKILDVCDKALAEVETALEDRKAEFDNEEYWLCGRNFTAADIQLACILHRLVFVGLAERVFISKRPHTSAYYQRVLCRTTFRRECVYANSLFWSMAMPMARGMLKKARPFIFTLSLFAAVGAYAYHFHRATLREYAIAFLDKFTYIPTS